VDGVEVTNRSDDHRACFNAESLKGHVANAKAVEAMQ
jgi:hypothetical protein